ncbi:12355_t:CDS:2 [Acaulospora morrowiae]|uniref:12355_t:CDS:1 n=1 Tax=Acaulospora morrowiae TaxID=94023 RepID=A0A9N9F521_9GLOM|nr:12355_t:CDS:2 [Acaulospora morrowiae]
MICTEKKKNGTISTADMVNRLFLAITFDKAYPQRKKRLIDIPISKQQFEASTTSGQSHVIIPELRELRFLEPIADDAETSTRKFLFFGSTSLLSPSTCHPSDLGAAGKICGGALLNMSMELHINYVTITNGQTIFPLRDAMNQLYRFGQMS